MPRSLHGLQAVGEWRQFSALFPELKGKDVLDLGCGYGWHCRYAAGQCAHHVVGIDISEMMIAAALNRSNADNITYRVCSLSDYEYPAAAYDIVISNLVLHYVEDLDHVYHCVHKTLRTGGVFLINIEHPTFTAGVNQKFVANGAWPVYYYCYP